VNVSKRLLKASYKYAEEDVKMQEVDKNIILQEFIKKQSEEEKLTELNRKKIVDSVQNADVNAWEYKQIRVILTDLKRPKFKMGDFIGICEVKNSQNKIYLDADVGNVTLPLATVFKHTKRHFCISDFEEIWNNSVEI